MPYGDQTLFLKAELFHGIGGFPVQPIMEDFEMARRLRKRGRMAIAPVRVLSSARRWHRVGILKTTLINQLLIIAYTLGIPPRLIARWYYGSL